MRPCCICDAGARGSQHFGMCARCGVAYDRWQRSQDEDGTIWGVMTWAARRAVRAERRRVASVVDARASKERRERRGDS